jgi:hypothetical protein
MKIPKIVKVFPTTDTLAPWEQAREVAKELNPEPEFHWKNKAIMYRNIQAALGYNSIWDVYETIDFNEVAFEGYIASLHYVYFPNIDIPLNKKNPTWFDIWNACEEAIVQSHEVGNHHQYIEQVVQQGSSLYLHTGS